MTKILITGSNGFVGRNLVQAWQTKHDLVTLDLPRELFDNVTLEPFSQRIQAKHYVADLRDEQYAVADILVGIDVIVHCAARTRINPSWQEYSDYYVTNVTATQELYCKARQAGVKKFIYFSSSSIYGNAAVMHETNMPQPTNPYAVSKVAAELALHVESLRGGPELIIVRPFTMYGPYMNFGTYALAIAKFLKAARDNRPLQLDNGGTQRRDYTHINDAIQALDLILEKGQHGDIYNIGTGKTICIKDIADAISDVQVITPARVGHIEQTRADINRLQQLGYEPKEDFFVWLQSYMQQYKIVKNFKETL